MSTELRKTGIGVVGDITWGTHFCSFYESKQDLLDTLVPYFKAGLGDREFCLWVIADPLTREEAWNALRLAVPDLDRYESDQSIELFTGEEWYLQGGTLDLNRTTNAWSEKLDQALARGYQGMRVSGDTCWLKNRDWQDFCAYENHLNESISNQAMTVLCTYPLAQSGAVEILDVARAHQFAIVRRQGDWEVVETLELKQARAEIKKLNEELEQRVVERTGELAAVNEKLRDEVAERKRAQERLQEYEKVVEGLDEMIVVVDREFRYLIANRAFLDYRGVEKEQLLGHFVSEFLDGEIFEKVVKKKFNESLQGKVVKYELKYTYPKLGERDLLLSYFPIEGPDGVDRVACVLRDITDRKRAEELLRATSEQLRALSARLQSAREEEGARIAREIHDELGSALTTLKWDLETIDRENVEARDNADLGSIREKIAAMMQLIDTTTHTMKRISSELRPSILDDIGLVEAIDWQTQQFQTRTGIICNCDCGLENVDITQEQSTAIFRIFQEALTNILRHAQATQVDVAVKHEAGELVLTIKDNGRGISDEEKTSPQSLGLLGMRERVSLIGGQIDITGAKGEGTVATVRVPLFN